MNENILKAQVTIQQMQRLMTGLEDVGNSLPKNPKLYAFLAEAPIDELLRMLRELDQYLEPLKQTSVATTSTEK
ncbi:MAG: hypothetical protein WD669_09570 [Pirellulales bacterium]